MSTIGSVKGTSTVHAHIELVHRWKAALESSGTMTRVLLVDFSKAFDKVDHHILLTKCASLGLPNWITKWLTSFLCQRKQRVKIGSVKAKFTTINAGMPQGKIFGPIGFVHHINDLRTNCDHVKYVHDCTIWESGAHLCVNSSLQTAADEVAQWTTTNNMALNYDKTKQIRICFKKETPDIPPTTINHIQIEQDHSTRLLGVTISQDLAWQLHIGNISTKLSRLYFIILLKRAGIEPHNLVKIYTTIIRYVTEYACQVCAIPV